MIIFVAHKYYLVLCKTFRFDITSKNTLENGLFTLGIFILMVGSYAVQTNDNITTDLEAMKRNSGSGATDTHTFYTIEVSKALLNSKLPLIKKAVISQIYSAMGLTQKAGANNTATNLNALITNEIDNSTSWSSSLKTTKSLAIAIFL